VPERHLAIFKPYARGAQPAAKRMLQHVYPHFGESGRFEVVTRLAHPTQGVAHLDRCTAQYEDFCCVVSHSLRDGVPVRMWVE
jgi:hypothetical protein